MMCRSREGVISAPHLVAPSLDTHPTQEADLMGLLDRRKPEPDELARRRALDDAREPDEGAVTRLIQMVLDRGLDGVGPFDSAFVVAEKARDTTSSTDAAIAAVMRKAVAGAGIGGFATSVGGFITMPVALPANLVEFYVQAARMIGSIAILRGYDLNDPRVRTAVLLTLVGSQADDVLAQAGLRTGGGRITSMATNQLPPETLFIINKAVGFRLLRDLGHKALPKLGRGVPLLGGAVGAGFDGFLMKKIAEHAKEQFPPLLPDIVA